MKKILSILRVISIIVILVLAALVFIPNLLGITPTINLLDTMEPTISKGSISYTNQNFKYKDIKKNDIIEIKIYNQKNMVRVLSTNREDNTLTVKGDAESKQESIVITNKEYIGKYIFSIPRVGMIVLVLQRHFFLTIILVIIILISLVMDYIEYKNIDVTGKIKIKKQEEKKEKNEEPKKEEIKEEKYSKNNKKEKVIKKKNEDIEILNDDEIKEIKEILNKDKQNKKSEPEILYSYEEEQERQNKK